jgi:mannose-6-phosphate isomerase-like protein (cupin superfamily)
VKRALLATAALFLALSSSAQSGGKSEVFSSRQIQTQLQTLASQAGATGGSGVTLADYASHKLLLSVRTSSGGGEIHAHYDDVIIVQQGTATIVTGGSLVNPTTGPDGESKGSAVSGGKSREVGPGDVITVNAGVPHQTLVPAGTTYSALVIKVREP